ncbi:calcium-activated chloride channel regulator 1-like [Mixophyes fleayi]|uniref:calcium-activated chloride channel regulator 1-like n=1 Tax=Mixophyes fleayi TaxID=3061075 RepID=UPI003F4D9CC9
MATRKISSFIVFFLLISVTESSFIQLNNGSYEDIVIGINPGLQENDEIIDKIKEMVMDASNYLFYATENRLFIKSVKILIPLTWTEKYTRRKRETYEKADIIITNPFLKYGDDPYTFQYKGCGEQGKYIHLTPNFLLNTSLTSLYGSPGRIFVHEWAHFRWGVFDEYNTISPYYLSGDHKIEATRCSANVKGTNVIQECEGDSCLIRMCNIDSNTGLYEEGCLFLPEKDQDVQESIMYLQALPSVTAFCNESNHNIEAPSLQNRMCNLRSTWDVIMNSTDISSTPPRLDTKIPVPIFTLLQYKNRVITLACDISGSMVHFDRIGRLFQAAEFFLTHIIETGSYVGIVEFSTFAFTTSKLVQIISDQDRAKLISLVPSTIINEGSDICTGILEALKVNEKFNGFSAGTEIILVTDGEDKLKQCFGSISDSGAIIHIIALGSEASQELGQIADMTGGQKHFSSDNADANDLIDAFSVISNGNGDIAKQTIQLESRSLNLEPDHCLNGTVFIDSTVGNSTFFLIIWQVSVPSINLQDPEGNIYLESRFTNNSSAKSSRLQIPGKAESGAWNYSLCNSLNKNQVVGIIVTSKAVNASVPPVIVNVHMNQETNNYPNPMIVYASVQQGLLPVTEVKVTAFIESESGNSVILELLDNGAGGDIARNDGVYSKYFTSFTENGRYSLKVRVEGGETESRLVAPKNRAHYIPGYVENGMMSINPPRPVVNDEDLHIIVDRISRTISGGFFTVNNVPTSTEHITYSPGKITDLEAKAQGNSIALSWTATGDDLDQGRVSRYDLRINISPRDLRDNFRNSTQVDISNFKPQLAGSRETFTFVPGDVVPKNEMVLYFALTAIDKDNQESHISNIVQAVLFTSTVPETTSVLSHTLTDSTMLVTDSTFTSLGKTLPTSFSTIPVTSFPQPATEHTTSLFTSTVPESTSVLSHTPTDSTMLVTDSTFTSLGKTLPTSFSTIPVTSFPQPATEHTTSLFTSTVPESTSVLSHTPTDSTMLVTDSTFTSLGKTLPTSFSTIPVTSFPQPATEHTTSLVTSKVPESTSVLSHTPTDSTMLVTDSTFTSLGKTLPTSFSTIPVTSFPQPVTEYTTSLFTSTVPESTSVLSHPPTDSTMLVTDSTFTSLGKTLPTSFSTIPLTSFPQPVTEYTTSLTDNPTILTNINTLLISSTIQQTAESTPLTSSITTKSTPVINNTITQTKPVISSTNTQTNPLTSSKAIPSTKTTASSPSGNINVTVLIVVVCVVAVVICIIISVTVYCVQKSKRGSFRTLA